MEQKTGLLKNPKGTEGILHQEAMDHFKLVSKIEKVFIAQGYIPAKVPVFDYFDVYQEFYNEPSSLFRLFDKEGELLVLRSDITLFLAKQLGRTLTKENLPLKVFYADSILRHEGQTDISKDEYFQVGAELVGVSGLEGDLEIISMMAQTMEKTSTPYYCHIGSRSFFEIVTKNLSAAQKKKVYKWITSRELKEIAPLLQQEGGFSKRSADAIVLLFSFIGTATEFKAILKDNANVLPQAIMSELNSIVKVVEHASKLEGKGSFRLDLSEIGRMPYYTGMVFTIYVDGCDNAVGSGGRYDKMLSHFGFDCPSVGFSIFLRKIKQSKIRQKSVSQKALSIALPKGRLQKKVQEMFAKRGVEIDFEDRKLVAYDKNKEYKFILVKNGDLPTYVNYGIAGIGVCGTDVIYESGFEFYKPLTFSFGSTTMCLAGKKGESDWKDRRPLLVSSKFTKFTRDYFTKLGIPVEIIKLNGSVELGPVLGLTPFIVDLVETGSTLVANNLEVIEKLKDIKVKMVCNPAYYKIHYKKINRLVDFLKE